MALTAAQKIAQAMDQILDRIIEVTASNNPDYTTGNRTISKGAYLTQLRAEYSNLSDLLLQEETPWEVKTKPVW